MTLSNAALRHLREVADQPDLTGTRYELLAPLGRGGMGAVYRVRDTALDRDVALKVLSGAPGDAALQQLEREARVLARLEHPGIVPVHDVGVLPDGRLFYVMKLVHGEPLAEAASRIAGTAERLRLVARVADAVAFAHSQGVVHRDLTPANVMIGQYGEVLVMDWGLALTASDEAGRAARVVAGTPGFMAPEQAQGLATPASDVYALGALVQWWLAPAQRGTPRLPPAVASIVARAMAEDPASRYPSAAAFSSDVISYLDGETVSAHRESGLERLVRFGKKYRVAILLVLGYLLMRVTLLLVRGL